MPLPLWFRSLARRQDSSNRKMPLRKNQFGHLHMELLEDRLAPSITPVPDFAHNAVAFDGAPTDTLYLKIVGGLLEWSPDGVNFTSNVDPNPPGVESFTVNSASQITSNLFSTLYIEGMTGGAGTYTATNGNIQIDQSIFTEGSNLSFVSTAPATTLPLRRQLPRWSSARATFRLAAIRHRAYRSAIPGNLSMQATNITLGTATNYAALYSQVEAGSCFTPGSITLAVTQDGGIGTGTGFDFPLLPQLNTRRRRLR